MNGMVHKKSILMYILMPSGRQTGSGFNDVERKNQLDATQWFIELIICLPCFRHYYAHLQELETIQMVTAWGMRHFVAGRWSGVELQAMCPSRGMLIDQPV